MKRTATILLAVLGLLLAACTSDSTTDAGGQLDSNAATEGDGATDDQAASDGEEQDEGGDGSGQPSDDGADDGADGEGEGEGDDDPAESAGGAQTLRTAVLGRALERTDAMTSASFEGVVTMVGTPDSELPGEFTMTFSGAFDLAAEASMVTLDMGDLFAAAAAADPEGAEGMEDLFASMFEDPMQMITIGDTSWVKWGLLAMFGVEDKWLEGEATEDSMTSGFGFGGDTDSPTAMLEELADADARVEVVGQEDIRGVTTTHHRAELDVAAMAETMSAEERAEFEADLGAAPDGTFVMDLWIDDDDLLHRFQLTMTDLTGVDAEDLESMTMVYDIWDHGLDQGISPPPADQIVTEEELGLSLDDLGGFSG